MSLSEKIAPRFFEVQRLVDPQGAIEEMLVRNFVAVEETESATASALAAMMAAKYKAATHHAHLRRKFFSDGLLIDRTITLEDFK